MTTLFEPAQRRCRLPPELEPMTLNLKLMKILGIWGERHERKYYRFLLALGWATFIILFPKAVFGMGSNNFDVIAKGWSEFLFEGNLLLSVFIFALQGAHFERMINAVREVIKEVSEQSQECYELLRKHNAKLHKFTKIVCIYDSIAPCVFSMPATVTNYTRYFSASGNDSKPIRFEIPMEQEFFGIDLRTNFLNNQIFLVLSITAYYVCAYTSAIKISTLLVMIKYNSLTYRVVALLIRELDQVPTAGMKINDPQQKAKIEKLAKIVDLHQRAFDITEMVEEIIYIPMALEFLTCIAFWCTAMFYISTNMNLNVCNVMVLFGLSLIETYGFSYLGTDLIDAAGDVSNAIYDLKWYDDSAQFQRFYRLMIQRSQQVTGVTVAKFSPVGLSTFASVTQMSYSYYLVLKNTLMQK